jgi:hypothetical protein
MAEVVIECASMTEDDRSHAVIAQIEEGVQTALDKLYSNLRKKTGASASSFKTAFDTECAPCTFGYMTFSSSSQPYDSDGVNVVSMSISIHYARSDFNL